MDQHLVEAARVLADGIQSGLSTLGWSIFCGFIVQAIFNR